MLFAWSYLGHRGKKVFNYLNQLSKVTSRHNGGGDFNTMTQHQCDFRKISHITAVQQISQELESIQLHAHWMWVLEYTLLVDPFSLNS